MKKLIKIYELAIQVITLWIIGGILISIGIYINSLIIIGIGGIFIYWAITEIIKDYRLDKELENWLSINNGKILFFYATTKKIQERISNEIIPLFKYDILKAYYNGPKIAGDLKDINHLLFRIMESNRKIRPHNPSIIKIENNKFIVKDELKFLMNIEDETLINKNEIIERINKASV